MKKNYSVTYTPKGATDENRVADDYRTKAEALSAVRRRLKEGCTKVFLDTFDSDFDLIDYKHYEKGDIVK